MALLQQGVWTIEAFQAYIIRPDNADRLFELINGEIIEKMPGRTRNSFLSMKLDRHVYPFCVQHNIPCYTSGGDGAYTIGGHIIAPDFAFKTTPMSADYPDPTSPLWAVEIVSPTDRAVDIRTRRDIYIQASILYWELYPDLGRVDVYPPAQPARSFALDDILDGAPILPGFQLAVKTLFAQP
jgi:Uma2 family endonuclease